ncbi:hypothetical protein HUT16_11635 [Kitasatospora sp. NA04385]|uniref:hypothetical protein n=1 Tax=Kitasatospora sp. NA04385 TaxID=2742135 RepID=UPI0015926C4D|nr:hypothetical protein [Kitasatospora sp. NA04385]QKW19629.1 hypothetical protein HUT16_11635 [Kitasatospora sp. NA04385]
MPPAARCFASRWFTAPETRARFPAEQHGGLVRAHIVRPDDPRIAELLRQLHAAGNEFEAHCGRCEVSARRAG